MEGLAGRPGERRPQAQESGMRTQPRTLAGYACFWKIVRGSIRQPMAFRQIVGHSRLLSLLSRAIARQSLTPSLILSGPEGVGKRLTAISIAQELNCLTIDDAGACGVCTVCSRIARGSHALVGSVVHVCPSLTSRPTDTSRASIIHPNRSAHGYCPMLDLVANASSFWQRQHTSATRSHTLEAGVRRR